MGQLTSNHDSQLQLQCKTNASRLSSARQRLAWRLLPVQPWQSNSLRFLLLKINSFRQLLNRLKPTKLTKIVERTFTNIQTRNLNENSIHEVCIINEINLHHDKTHIYSTRCPYEWADGLTNTQASEIYSLDFGMNERTAHNAVTATTEAHRNQTRP